MAINCYEFDRPVEVCVDGAVGGGDTADMRVYATSGGGFDIASSPIGVVSDWDGSPAVFNDIVDSSFSGCDVIESTLTVTLVGDNEVEVTMEIRVENCPNGGGVYNECGGSPGEHTFTDSKILPMTGASCSQ